MKKMILIIITLTTLANVSYASFPVTEDMKFEVVEESIYLIESPKIDRTWIYSVSSFLLGILGWFFVFMLIGGAMGGSPDSVLDRFFIFYIISSVGAVVLGVLSVMKRSKGYILGILGTILGILAISLGIFSG